MKDNIRLDYLKRSLAFLRDILNSPERIGWCRDFGADVPKDFQEEVGEFLLGYRESGAGEACSEALARTGGLPADAALLSSGEFGAMSDDELESQLAALMDGDSPFVLYGMSSGLLYRLFGELLARKQQEARSGSVFRLSEADLPDVAALSEALRPGSGEAVSRSFRRQMADPKAALFGCRLEDELVGLAHARIRTDYVEGARDRAGGVAYLEGIYLKDGESALAPKLVEAVGAWAREAGCRELAADCEQGDAAGSALREAAGFREAAKIICYIKEL